jgi:Uma2 family endonuclease
MTTSAAGAYRRKPTEQDFGDGNGEVAARDPSRATTSRRRHDVIVGNIVGELRSALRDMPCEVYPAGLKVRTEPHETHAADVTVVCSAPRFQDDDEDILINPTILFEVIAEVTEAADRGEKFEAYGGIPSVAEYLLVSTTHARVERFVRHADGSWNYRAFGRGEVVPLSTAGCQLKVDEVYLKAFPKANGL